MQDDEIDEAPIDASYMEIDTLKKVIEQLNYLGNPRKACQIIGAAAIFLNLPIDITQKEML